MRILRNMHISTKLTLLLALMGALALLASSAAFVANEVSSIRSSTAATLSALGDVVGANMAAALTFNDSAAAAELLASLRRQPLVTAAGVYDRYGSLFATYPSQPAPALPPGPPTHFAPKFDGAAIEVARPIDERACLVGTIVLRAQATQVHARIRRALLIVGAVLAVSLLAAVSLSLRLQRLISAPILRLAGAARAVSAQGNYAIRVKKEGNDEIGELCDGFNAMLAQIQARDAELELNRKRLEEALRDATAASQAKSQFLANMSHEIRTPLNGVIGMTELVLATPLTREQREYLDMGRTSANALLGIINDILDFSKIEAGRLELEDIPFDLRTVVEATLDTLAAKAHGKGIELACRIPPDVPTALIGDPERLRQVLSNLTHNAVKFTEQGEVVLHVDMEPDGGPDFGSAIADCGLKSEIRNPKSPMHAGLHFRVCDTGIGIPPEKLDTIFESFTQADGSITRKYGGTGLGTTIAKQIVEKMGGRIWLESQVGRGTTAHVVLRFPLAPPQPQPLPRRPEADLTGIRVLIVDDNATNRIILREVTAAWGMAPSEAPSAAEGLVALLEAQAAGRPFQLILLDAHMPEVSGFGFAERARRLPGHGRVPMVLLTSAGSRGDADLCARLGISAYLMKPVKQSELHNTIAAVLDPRFAQGGQGAVVTRHALREARRRLRVLFAEDNPVNQRVGAAILGKQGHSVLLAANGREALRALEGDTFDLVLMDVQMPEMDGLEAARLIRGRERASGGHIPIVAMTAHALKGDRERCLEAGMDGYIAKPIRPAALIETIERLAAGAPDSALKSEIRNPKSEMTQCPVFDHDAALQAVGGDTVLLREVTDIFIEDSPKRLEEARSALGRGDAEALARAAHTLKGAAGAVCACRVQSAARDLEAAARAGPNGPCAHLLESLQAQFDMFRTAVEREAAGAQR